VVRVQTDTVVAELEFALVVADTDPVRVSAYLRYDVHDPFAVCVSFDAGPAERIEWTFARELLDAGLWQASGEGDVRIWPKGTSVMVALCSPSGRAILETPRQPVADFVARTLRLVPIGHEAAFVDLDRELIALLS
jgi:Streptomyces sporulation and cell division protein, SsgA